jgi:UDP-N-acetylmuramyl pentapeptide phosphotransferase/UDP-N-acetylglucosamine-1-phosphate transferase
VHLFALSVVSAFAASYCVARFLVAHEGFLLILDHPNERSLHLTPTPRTGGLAIWIGSIASIFVVVGVLGMKSTIGWMGCAALFVGFIAFIDDWTRVSAVIRLTMQLIGASLLSLGGLDMQSIAFPGVTLYLPVQLGVGLTMLFVVWMINLYNFMDGMDGFAGGMAVLGFAALGLLGLLADDGYFAAICWAIAAAAAGFLTWNFPPARIFMGDFGSSALGFMAAALSLWGDKLGLFPLWVAILVFSPFVVDATVTLVVRIFRRERFWDAHRSHYYQRLVRLGWGHKKTVVLEYGLMAGCSITAVLLLKASPAVQWVGLAAWGGIYASGIYAVGKLEISAQRLRTL